MRQIAKQAAKPLAVIELPEDRPWQVIKGERGRDRFEAFLALGPTRTLSELARVAGVPQGTVDVWSSRYCWLERAAAYDVHYAEHAGAQLRAMRDPINVEVTSLLHAEVLRFIASVRDRDPNELDLDATIRGLGMLLDRLDKYLNPRAPGGGGGGTTVNVAVQVGEVDSRLEAFTARLSTVLDRVGLTPEQWAILDAGMRE